MTLLTLGRWALSFHWGWWRFRPFFGHWPRALYDQWAAGPFSLVRRHGH